MNIQNTRNHLYLPLNAGNLASRIGDMMLILLKWQDNIEKALKHSHGTHDFDDVTAAVLRGELELWDFGDCYCLTRINVFPQYSALHFFIAGGNMKAMFAKAPFFKEVARERGCKMLTLAGRKGWDRAGLTIGWKETVITMQMEVDL